MTVNKWQEIDRRSSARWSVQIPREGLASGAVAFHEQRTCRWKSKANNRFPVAGWCSLYLWPQAFVGRRSTVGIAAGGTGDRIPVGGANFPHRSRPSLRSTHSASCTMGAGSISRGVRWPEGLAWRWPPTPSRAEVKEWVQQCLYWPSVFSWQVIGWIYYIKNQQDATLAVLFISNCKTTLHFMFEFPCIITLYYIKNQQDATLAVLFISNCKITLHVSDAFCLHHQEY